MTARGFLAQRRGRRRTALCATRRSGRRTHSRRRRSDLRGGRDEHQSRHRSPLRAARGRGGRRRADLRAALARVLDGLDRNDAELVFDAILRASPGGLGDGAAPRCPSARPTVALLEAMAEAAERDRDCAPICVGFPDIFVTGLAALATARAMRPEPTMADGRRLSGLSRGLSRHATSCASMVRPRPSRVQHEAREMRFASADADIDGQLATIFWLSTRSLKSRGFNPGTSADLTVATLFADRLTSTSCSTRPMMVELRRVRKDLRRYLANRPCPALTQRCSSACVELVDVTTRIGLPAEGLGRFATSVPIGGKHGQDNQDSASASRSSVTAMRSLISTSSSDRAAARPRRRSPTR